MNTTFKIASLLNLFALGLAFQVAKTPAMVSKDYVPDEVLVRFRRGVKAEENISRLGGVKLSEFWEVGWHRIRITTSVAEALTRFRSSGDVEAVQPNFIYRLQATADDPRLPDLYGLNQIQAPAAWEQTTGSAAVVVAVIDLGVDYNHEDLNPNMWRNPGESGLDGAGLDRATNNVDDDGNGYVDDVYGIDTINNDSNPVDDHGHGTHVAGTIGAVGNNAKGVVGVNWSVGIMAIKSHDSQGNGTSASVIEAFQYATNMRHRGINVRVTNSSWGGAPEAPSFDQALKEAIDLAGNAGILNVCAAGNANNDNDANPFYPASYDSTSIISVAASDAGDTPAGFSSYGATSVDIAAPGVEILSTGIGNQYVIISGTSMATPYVSGAAALLIARNSLITRSQLKGLLLNGVDPSPPSWANKPTVTAGRLNVLKALNNIPTTNQIDSADFFVRQQYLDFLGREPDAGGLDYWSNEIALCGTDTNCIHNRRIGVSGAFFVEAEFQRTGSFVYRAYKGGLGRRPSFDEFTNDRMQIVEGPNLEQTREDFALSYVQKAEFVNKYQGRTTAAEFVDALLSNVQQNSNVNLSAQRDAIITSYLAGADQNQARAFALREAIDSNLFTAAEYNPAFVLMQYFGYLQRDPDQDGYDFWLDVVNNRGRNDYPAMICGFITSIEYQVRFAPVVTRTNQDCMR